jgi:hypothetical protein
MTQFQPRHVYKFSNENQFPDKDTETLLRDAMAVYASQYQGVCIGPWLEDRLRHQINLWFPEWSCSHAQITADDNFDLQSRSWDIVLHRPPPPELGYPPSAYPNGSFPLIPKSQVAAVVDSKGLLTPSGLRKYCAQVAYDRSCASSTTQFNLIGGAIPKILFCFTSTTTHQSLSSLSQELGAFTFVLAMSKTNKNSKTGRIEYEWDVQNGSDGVSPFMQFRTLLEESVDAWQQRHRHAH